MSQLDVTAGTAYGLRVYLAGVSSAMCTGSSTNWAYLNNTDSNYSTYLAALLMAKATGARVTLYLTFAAGQCQIGYLTVS